jgi:hypothetical protein
MKRRQDYLVSVVMRPRAGKSGVEILEKFFSSPKRPFFLWDIFSNSFDGYRSSFSDVDQPGRVADHLRAPSEMAKKACSYSFTLSFGFIIIAGTNASFNCERKGL